MIDVVSIACTASPRSASYESSPGIVCTANETTSDSSVFDASNRHAHRDRMNIASFRRIGETAHI
ncbi:hypothetical protein RSSM_01369 [Rhodopirellula sallentina SM41]|uniref:Uncharacterized protein n=1 Tax=Rhodopirellula sallentina SM41 TaxID=1263870 RepID=M5U6X1_9BACT|nr:hypothetical protein RSSM_01369 [Rhodopirellula sallentina SM41]